MAITSRSEDKFAFLFTGPSLQQYLVDLQNVFQTLTEYYNYPASHITVVLGSTPSSMPSFPGATVLTIATAADLQTALSNFALAASGPAPGLPGFSTSALLYFTGNGTGPGVSRLVIDGGSGTNSVDPPWLAARLNSFHDCNVNLFMQQSYGGGFLAALTASTLTEWSFTSACSSSEQTFSDPIEGSFFTARWTRGLECEVLPPGTVSAGQFADMLGSIGEASNLLISLDEARQFAQQVNDLDFGTVGPGATTSGYTGSGGSQRYLGLPSFLIRDGSPWWESEDIYLTHPNHMTVPPGDLYIPDAIGAVAPFNNTINVDVRNVGTHPVRKYSLGIELFKSGMGAVNEQNTMCNIVPSGGVLLPIDLADIGTAGDRKNTASWNTAFTTGTTHECVKAEATLLCGDVDFSWSITANDFEGQRNTDPMPIAPPPPMPVPAIYPSGMKQHLFGLHNRFETTRRFLVVFPEEYRRAAEGFELAWFDRTNQEKAETIALEVDREPTPHLNFVLKGGERRELLFRAKMRPGIKLEQGIRLPFRIVVDAEQGQVPLRFVNERGAETPAIIVDNARQAFADVAGFTVVLEQQAATLIGTIRDDRGAPAAGARVFLRTVDDLQGATIVADSQGQFRFAGINPDVYRVWAEAGNWRSSEMTVILFGKPTEAIDLAVNEPVTAPGPRVKVILDRIRILDDHDPCLKGGGELTFTSVVVPDNDEARKKVTRLPGTGAYSVSDRPGRNEIQLGVVLFDDVVRNRSLTISINGLELDKWDSDDELNRYHRVFSGDPGSWYGQYGPSDEYLDAEDVGDWALWYRIVRE